LPPLTESAIRPRQGTTAEPGDTARDPRAEGLILFVVLGLAPLAAAALVWLRHPLAPVCRVRHRDRATAVLGGLGIVAACVAAVPLVRREFASSPSP